MSDTVNHLDLPVTDYKPQPATVRVLEDSDPCMCMDHPTVETVLVVRRREVQVYDFYRNRPA